TITTGRSTGHGRSCASCVSGPVTTMSAAVAAETDQIRLRSGSLELNDPSARAAAGATANARSRTATMRRTKPPLREHAVPLEHLGVLAVDVDAVRPRQVPHVLGI